MTTLAFKILIVTVIALTTAGLSAYGMWEYRGQKIEALEAVNARQELVIANRDQALADQEAVFETYEKQVEALQLESMKYFHQSAEIRKKYDQAVNLLSRHDRNFLAISKPGLTSKILDKESREIDRCEEIVRHGENAVLTDRELSATKPSEINRFCWDIANPAFNPGDWPEWSRRNLR